MNIKEKRGVTLLSLVIMIIVLTIIGSIIAIPLTFGKKTIENARTSTYTLERNQDDEFVMSAVYDAELVKEKAQTIITERQKNTSDAIVLNEIVYNSNEIQVKYTINGKERVIYEKVK